MRIRPLAYFILFALNLYLLIAQVQLYQSPVETITSPQLGYYNLSKTLFTIVLIDSVIMLPYMVMLLIGAVLNASWLYPARLYCAITAIIIVVSFAIFEMYLSFWTVPKQFVAVDISFLYLFAEGSVSVLEAFKRG
jgi:hypothetical protein